MKFGVKVNLRRSTSTLKTCFNSTATYGLRPASLRLHWEWCRSLHCRIHHSLLLASPSPQIAEHRERRKSSLIVADRVSDITLTIHFTYIENNKGREKVAYFFKRFDSQVNLAMYKHKKPYEMAKCGINSLVCLYNKLKLHEDKLVSQCLFHRPSWINSYLAFKTHWNTEVTLVEKYKLYCDLLHV